MSDLQSQLARAAALYEKIGWPKWLHDDAYAKIIYDVEMCVFHVIHGVFRSCSLTDHEAAALIEKDLRERLMAAGCLIVLQDEHCSIRSPYDETNPANRLLLSEGYYFTALLTAAEKVLV